MATDIVQGLFGDTPYGIQMAQKKALDAAALQHAQLDPLQRAAMSMYQGGGMLGGAGAEAMGMVNPQVEQARAAEQALTGIDTSNPDSILQRAQQVQDPRLKIRLTHYAQQMKAQLQEAMLKQQKMNIDKEELDFKRKDAFDLKKLEAEARIRQNDERIRDARTTAEERAALAKENNQIKLMLGQAMIAAKQGQSGLGKPPAGYRYTADGNLEPIPGGPKDMTSKNKAISDTAEMKAKLVTQKVDEALKETGFFSTGLTGEVLGVIPGTGAYDLDATLDTIKANLGFNELQAMRQASPTGGALGQVAVRELEMLQATIASLKKGQSQDKLRNSLAQVKKHYGNWKKAVDASSAQEGGQVDPATGAWSIKKKP